MATVQRQVVVPIIDVPMELMEDALKARPDRWEPVYDQVRGDVVGFHAPNYGSVMRCAYVVAEVDDETDEVLEIQKFQFDQMMRKDGPIGDEPWGHATPNAMAVVIEERDDGYYAWSVNEWRPAIYDHRREKQGVEVVGITGGWAKKVGANPVDTALEEIVAETGIEIEEGSVEFIEIHSPNRATVETCNEVYMAKFRAKGERVLDGSHEEIGDQFAVRLDQYPPGPDALVNSALWLVSQHLGCITAKPVEA